MLFCDASCKAFKESDKRGDGRTVGSGCGSSAGSCGWKVKGDLFLQLFDSLGDATDDFSCFFELAIVDEIIDIARGDRRKGNVDIKSTGSSDGFYLPSVVINLQFDEGPQ